MEIKAQLAKLLATIKAEESPNEKHLEVISSFLNATQKYGNLTSRQASYFESIQKQYSPEQQAEIEKCRDRLLNDKEYQNDLKIVVQFYAITGYYRNIVMRLQDWFGSVEANGGYECDVPANYHASIDRMLNNKYAQQVLESSKAAPLYPLGSLVTLRGHSSVAASTWRTVYDLLTNQVCIITKIDSKPIDKSLTYNKARGGTRYYTIFVPSLGRSYDIIERDLKRFSRKGKR